MRAAWHERNGPRLTLSEIGAAHEARESGRVTGNIVVRVANFG